MLKAWIQLIRPSNVLTAISDVLAGVALACLFLQSELPETGSLIWITLSSMLLYTGGIVFNDVFDAALDKIERPERPIPSGKVKQSSAAILGTIAFSLGCFLAYQVNMTAFYIALAIVLMCLLYNGKAKHHFIAGPIVMGSCRGLNLLLGMAVLPDSLSYFYLAIVPIIYIAAVTNISRGEVYGNNKTAILVSMGLYALVILTLIYFAFVSKNYLAFIFILFFTVMIASPLLKALKSLEPQDVRKSVKFGVLALILMNASWIAISGYWVLALAICAILPVSIFLAKKFAVT
ncbi:UbiA-like protein EboC [Sphingobacterium daejeonense]|uniref:UbiA-like protein EboC n=1 Tax=Sphingobacterium daejeonense TaxID=371142 RepID=UPI0021A7E8DD|nr:UbiA-like protein EboC [Sphingobacterium daejeonense]MCT1529426.1 UbiA-like protein EboC [Sphingobacterium daejeonense]